MTELIEARGSLIEAPYSRYEQVVYRCCPDAKRDAQHVVERAASSKGLRIDQCGTALARVQEAVDHVVGLSTEDGSELADGLLLKPSIRDAGRKYGPGCYQKVLGNVRAGDDDNTLLSQPGGVKGAELLSPSGQSELRIMRQNGNEPEHKGLVALSVGLLGPDTRTCC